MDLFGIGERHRRKSFEREISVGIQNEFERFGTGTAEYFRAYSTLAKISKSKINPDYAKSNLMQQAGNSAEVKNVSRINAENAIKRRSTRVARTDDIGAVHHEQFDRVNVDANGNPILDKKGRFTGGTQQKNFYKVRNYDKLLTKEYEHYKGVPVELPPDQFEDIMRRWDNKISNYRKQIDYLKKHGEPEKAAEIEQRVKQIEDVKGRAKPSKVSTGEAMDARLNPAWSTAKDILSTANDAGLQSAAWGAGAGCAISACQCFVAVRDGDMDFDEALVKVVKDTGGAAVSAYLSGAGSSVLGGALKASGKEVCKGLAEGNAPAAVLQAGVVLTKSIWKLANGEISSEQFVEDIGREGATLGASMLGGNIGAAAGTCVLPGVGTVVGGVVGAMIASLASGAVYEEFLKVARENKLSDEKRKMVHDYCEYLKSVQREYQYELQACFDVFFAKKEKEVRESFLLISEAASRGRSVHAGLTRLAKSFNMNLRFESQEQFDKFFASGETLEL